MKSYFLMIPIVFILLAPVQARDYFQNDVRYEIDVTLDDSLHEVSGTERILFTNHSPDTLDHLVFLLHPNAYRDESSAYARQQRAERKTRFHFSKEDERGWITVSAATIGTQQIEIEPDPENSDLATLWLPQSLHPEDSVRIRLDFCTRIPILFSRLGRRDNHYDISQWYPKIAVYDHRGWADYVYLDHGEFYSEFGLYDVSITVPVRYQVAATGILQTASEIQRRDSLASQTEKSQALSPVERRRGLRDRQDSTRQVTGMKTVRYRQDRIHDFAWFADPDFLIQKRTMALPNSGREIELFTYVMPKNEKAWENALDYLEDAIQYYSRWYGDYPYDAMTAVDGGITAGGGMEYPMITVVATMNVPDMLEMMIMHETGHNWFYGALGSDERRYAWMDEGLNTFSEMRYFREKYGADYQLYLPKPLKFLTRHFTHQNLLTLIYRQLLERSWTVPYDLPVDEYVSTSLYYHTVYFKIAHALFYLQEYLDAETFDAMMQAYYQRWKFKHPMPQDFQDIVEEFAAEDVEWFFRDWLASDKNVDYHLKKVEIDEFQEDCDVHLLVTNDGDLQLPYRIEARAADRTLYSFWRLPERDTCEHQFSLTQRPDQIVIDPQQISLDRNPYNNSWKRPIQLQPLVDLPNPYYRQIFVLPYIWYNHADGLLGKLYFRAPRFFPALTKIDGAIGYGLKSHKPLFDIDIGRDAYRPSGRARYESSLRYQECYCHRLLSLGASYEHFPKFEQERLSHRFSAQLNYLNIYDANDYDPGSYSTGQLSNWQLRYQYQQKFFLSKIVLDLQWKQGVPVLDTQSQYTKLLAIAEWKRALTAQTDLNLRGYWGWISSPRHLPLQDRLYASGGLDPLFQNPYIFDRSVTPAESKFILLEETLLRGYPGLFSDHLAWGINAELQYKILGLFFDAALFDQQSQTFRYSFGPFLKIAFVHLYMPVYLSDRAQDGSRWIRKDRLSERLFYTFQMKMKISF